MAVKQYGSHMCFVCGAQNPIGLHLDFWMDGDRVWTDFTPGVAHQGYPGVMHGGLLATILDETMGRAAALKSLWMMSAKVEVSYRLPVPLEQTLRCTARIEDLRQSRMIAVGEIVLQDGALAVQGRGLYVRIPDERKEEFMAALTGQGVSLEGL